MLFDIYKRNQGKYTRLYSAFGAAIIVALGCYQLYRKLEVSSWWGLPPRTILWIATMVPVALFVGLALLIFWLVNKPNVVDFLVAAEGEMKKVSWSSRQEIIVSTFIVIMVVIIIGVLLGVADIIFTYMFRWIFI
jgi:preprotein translocase subunit SecE